MTLYDKRVSVRPRGVDQSWRVGSLEETAPSNGMASVGPSDCRGGNSKRRGGEVRPRFAAWNLLVKAGSNHEK